MPAPTGGPVCRGCWQAVRTIGSPVCDRCGAPILGPTEASPRSAASRPRAPGCPRCPEDTAVVRRRAVGGYDGTLRLIIHAFKYEGRRSLAAPLAALMRRAGAELLEGADAAVPVPLHWRRRWRRGFNQAEDLASRLGPPVVRAIRRTRATAPQSTLTSRGRRRNVRSAFALGRDGHRVVGRRVVLVDDVCTTGATLDACAGVLTRAGARAVTALTIAATPRAAPPRRPPRPPGARRRP